MSKILSKLEELAQRRSFDAFSVSEISPPAPALKIKWFRVLLALGIVTLLAEVFFLGSLSSNLATIKNTVFFSMDANIQQQQNQILILNKKLIAMQSLMDNRTQNAELATKNLNKVMQTKLSAINNINNKLEARVDNLNNSVKSKLAQLNQATTKVDYMETNLQAKIDELNAKLNKLQMSVVPLSPNTGDQTTVATAN